MKHLFVPFRPQPPKKSHNKEIVLTQSYKWTDEENMCDPLLHITHQVGIDGIRHSFLDFATHIWPSKSKVPQQILSLFRAL